MIPLVCCIINLTQKKGGDAMNTTLTRLLLEEVYLPNRYPYYPNSLAEYSTQEIQAHEAEFEKLGLLKFWKQKAFYSIVEKYKDHMEREEKHMQENVLLNAVSNGVH